MARMTPAEQALHDAWMAHPQVAAFHSAVRDHVATLNLTSGPEPLTSTLRFANAWIAANGELPDSGIPAS